MNRDRLILGVFLVQTLLLGASPPQKKKDDAKAAKKVAARKSADALVKSLDNGKYAESWDKSSENFRKAVTKEKWVAALNGTRKPLGRLRGRKLNRVEMKEWGKPGRPDEAWVYYDIRLGDGNVIGELAVVVLEGDGSWKSMGYYVAPAEKLPKPPEK